MAFIIIFGNHKKKNGRMLSVENVFKSIDKKEIIRGLSVNFEEGKITGLLGPNGAGKTTLIRMINQILSPDKGVISWQNKLMTPENLTTIGYLPEERGLYRNMSVLEHALFFGALKGMPQKNILHQLDWWLEKWSIQDWKNKNIGALSKGMAQKIQFLLTVLHQPDILILDEPFSGFDPVNIDLIRQELLRLKAEGNTIIISTHNMKSVEEICDKAVMINEGRKIAEETVINLQKAHKQDIFSVTFKGNMIAFANALWVGYEIVEKFDKGQDVFEVHLKTRRENTFNDLLQTLIAHVEIIAATELLPSMEKVFLAELQQKTEEE
jgi:ABC-2 type transport system ATP-binding protein